jgi:cell division protein FtsB
LVTRKWLRAGLIALALYSVAAAVIGYFGVNAYSGNRGLRAKQDLDEQIAQLNGELASLRAERATWERRVLLLRSGSIDPDMLDELALRHDALKPELAGVPDDGCSIVLDSR